jgi:tetratricopeptide (TPR) repeat protein
VISELTLLRIIGLAPALAAETRSLTREELASQSRLAPEVVRALALYDVLEPLVDHYGYRDLVSAREVARLMRDGLLLGDIISAAIMLRHSGRTLSNTRLCEAPWGDLLQEVAGRRGRLDGQFTLPLPEDFASVDDLVERAEAFEREGEYSTAERLYRIALRIDRTDPVLHFNLGNLLDAADRTAEAALAYQQAIACDPQFAEAWLNFGCVKEGSGDHSGAKDCYARAIASRPEYADALFNLAMLLTRDEEYGSALPLWERFLRLSPSAKDAQHARRMATLCRMHGRPATSLAVASG